MANEFHFVPAGSVHMDVKWVGRDSLSNLQFGKHMALIAIMCRTVFSLGSFTVGKSTPKSSLATVSITEAHFSVLTFRDSKDKTVVFFISFENVLGCRGWIVLISVPISCSTYCSHRSSRSLNFFFAKHRKYFGVVLSWLLVSTTITHFFCMKEFISRTVTSWKMSRLKHRLFRI
jgi:hypothetical protein